MTDDSRRDSRYAFVGKVDRVVNIRDGKTAAVYKKHKLRAGLELMHKQSEEKLSPTSVRIPNGWCLTGREGSSSLRVC